MKRLTQLGYKCPTGKLSFIGAAHSVGHNEDAMLRAFAPGVFVILSFSPDIR